MRAVADAGESTLDQLVTHYGRAEADAQLRSLKAVFLSHMHADHYAGVFSVLRRRFEVHGGDPPPLFLITSVPLANIVEQYARTVQPLGTLRHLRVYEIAEAYQMHSELYMESVQICKASEQLHIIQR